MGDERIEADANNPLFQHEYGHYIQSQSIGMAYYPRVGIPSIGSKDEYDSKSAHDYNPVEQDANARSIKYFHKKIGSEFIWHFGSNPIGYPGTNWSMSEYDSEKFQNVLRSLKIRASVVDYAFPIINGIINSDHYNTNYVDYDNVYYEPRPRF